MPLGQSNAGGDPRLIQMLFDERARKRQESADLRAAQFKAAADARDEQRKQQLHALDLANREFDLRAKIAANREQNAKDAETASAGAAADRASVERGSGRRGRDVPAVPRAG